MYLCILLFPLLGFIGAAGFGRFLGSRGSAIFTTTLLFFTFTMSCRVFYEVGLCGSLCTIELSPWFVCETWDANWGFLFDPLTAVMCVVVTSVSTMVHFYSIGYMGGDPHLSRFMSYLSLFTFFMLMLVTGDNFIQMFLGWEGVGLASYLLINFWFTRLQANKSAIKAMLMNRVGDFGLALGIFMIFDIFQSVNFQTVFACVPHLSDSQYILCGFEINALTAIGILLFVGAVGKSAQLGLHTWLPDAMEGPTPVSALIHAATMVTAGVFLLARCSPIYEFSPDALGVVAIVGGLTAFFAAITGLTQNDLKRVIAYSTCSQLGYMVFACGLSHYTLGVFHLANHAFFKALLFLGAGCVIHAVADEQDMRRMGGLARVLPMTYAMMLIGSVALVGFPFLTGFYSKDVLLEVAYAHYELKAEFIYILGATAAFCTSYYSFRLIALTFLGQPNGSRSSYAGVHEAPVWMGAPLLILALGSIFVGYLGSDMMVGPGTPFWGGAVTSMASHTATIESEYIPQYIKHLPFVFTVVGGSLGLLMNSKQFGLVAYSMKLTKLGRSLYIFSNRRWLFDKIYNDLIGSPSLNFGYRVSFKNIDKGLLEILGPTGISHTLVSFVAQVSRIQSGFIYHYAFVMLLGLTLFLSIFSIQSSVFSDPRIVVLWVVGFLTLSLSSAPSNLSEKE
uniref:NADH-ubiquinone oxidoreductase chain 5 n=1 Tax=Chloropicon maureeniae TaxID=1461542 RepID=A0A4D6C543_9CHLO|nr:NADH dehydrogenase subunit 5 [Chloropicon maureeniae]QBX98811.1 NADH dehydrogenase subunit 5 [Chloropicon maureeniae]